MVGNAHPTELGVYLYLSMNTYKMVDNAPRTKDML